MGLFSRGKNKVYSFEEAKRLMQTKKYERYIPVPVEGNKDGYRLSLEEPLLKREREARDNKRKIKEEKVQFMNRINENGAYINLNINTKNFSTEKQPQEEYIR